MSTNNLVLDVFWIYTTVILNYSSIQFDYPRQFIHKCLEHAPTYTSALQNRIEAVAWLAVASTDTGASDYFLTEVSGGHLELKQPYENLSQAEFRRVYTQGGVVAIKNRANLPECTLQDLLLVPSSYFKHISYADFLSLVCSNATLLSRVPGR